MDGTQFDRLVARLATTPLTRATALKGLAASAAALVGVGIINEAGTAKKKKTVTRQVCDCRSSDATTCTRVRINRQAKRRLLRRNPCAYPGRCVSGKTGCPSVGCQNNSGCTGGQVCQNNICVDCMTNGQCGGNQRCENGRCQTPPGFTCTPNTTTGCTDVNAGRVCNAAGTACVACNANSNCGGRICIDGLCQGGQLCDRATPDPCPDPLACQATEQAGDRDQCLLTGGMGGQGFGECTPLDVSETCPIQAGIQTQCVLGRCLRPCDANAACVPDEQGTCRNGFCVRAI